MCVVVCASSFTACVGEDGRFDWVVSMCLYHKGGDLLIDDCRTGGGDKSFNLDYCGAHNQKFPQKF